MRTTLDIADDVLQAAKEIAAVRGRTAGAVMSELVDVTRRRPRGPPYRTSNPMCLAEKTD